MPSAFCLIKLIFPSEPTEINAFTFLATFTICLSLLICSGSISIVISLVSFFLSVAIIIISSLSTPSGIVVVVLPVLELTLIQLGKSEPSAILPSNFIISLSISFITLKLSFNASDFSLALTFANAPSDN